MKYLVASTVAALFVAHAAHSAESLTAADFVAKASEAGMAEVELGKLATQKGMSPAVKQFGQHMVTDHTKANDELKKLATAKKIPAPAALNAAHQQAMDNLRKKSGADFDQAYAQQMVLDHNDAVALFSSAGSLPDQDLAAFANKTLPTLREHQQDANRLQTRQ
jgi:putative membrane protein